MATIMSKLFSLNLLKEKVRNRCMFASIILMLYILLVFILLALLDPPKLPPDQIEVISDLQNRYRVADSVENYSPSPRIRVKSSQKGAEVQDVPTRLSVVDYISNGDRNLPNCDASERTAIAGTLEYFRLAEVCRPVLKNSILKSDVQGLTTFSNFMFERGPVGRYGFQFSVEDAQQNPTVKSSKFYVNIESNVTDIKVLNSQKEIQDTVNNLVPGKPLMYQPVLKLFDDNGYPVVGKRVVAVSWPEPHFKGFGVQYDVWATKFALLSGDISEPSDDKGVARFKTLTFVGANFRGVFLHFICDNAVSELWDFDKSPILDTFSIPYIKTFIEFNLQGILFPALDIIFVGNYSTVVQEGQRFPQPFKVKVVQKFNANKPFSNQLVIAEIIQEEGNFFPSGYRQLPYGSRLKQLIKPFPAKYHEKYNDPYFGNDTEKMFIPILTDANGEVVFSELAFSVFGPAGRYRIMFSCIDYFTISDVIYVKSSVAQIKFIKQIPTFISVETSSIADKLVPTLQITNALGQGVPGKVPVLTLQDINNFVLKEEQISLFINNTKANEEFEPSDENGIIKITFHHQFIRQSSIDIKLKFTVEGVSVISSNTLQIENNSKDPQLCGNIIDLYDLSNNIQVNNSQMFDLTFLVLNEEGNPLPKAKAILNLDYNIGQKNWPPQQLLPVLSNDPSSAVKMITLAGQSILYVETDSNGLAKFERIRISRGQNCQYSLQVSAYSEAQIITPPNNTIISDGEIYISDGEFGFNGIQENNEDINSYDDQSEQIENFDIQDSIVAFFQKQQSGQGQQQQQKQTGASKMCFMPSNFQIFLSSQVQNLEIKSQSYSSVDDYYNLTLQISDINNVPIPNYDSSQSLNIILVDFPFYFADIFLATKDKATFYKSLFDFNTLDSLTDTDGLVIYQIKFKPEAKGWLGISFVCEGVFSRSEYLNTEFSSVKVNILTQPPTNCVVRRRDLNQQENADNQSSYQQNQLNPQHTQHPNKKRGRLLQTDDDENDQNQYDFNTNPNNFVTSTHCQQTSSFYVGNRIGDFEIQVLDSISNTPLQDYTVFAILDSTSLDSESNRVIIDIGDIYKNQNPVVSAPWRKAVTNSSGIALFHDLTFIDSRGFHCARIKFAVGHQYSNIMLSNPSNLYCFNNNPNVFIELQPMYSKYILPNKKFLAPLTVIRRGPLSDLEKNYKFYFMAGFIYDLEGEQLLSIIRSSEIMLDNYICYTMQLPGVPSLIVNSGNCQFKVDTIKNTIQFVFNKLLWILPGQQKFKLTFSTLLNFNVKQKQSSNTDQESANKVLEIMKLYNNPVALQTAIINELKLKNLQMPQFLQVQIDQIILKQQTLLNLRNIQNPSQLEIKQILTQIKNLGSDSVILQKNLINILLNQKLSAETEFITTSYQISDIFITQQPQQRIIYVRDQIDLELIAKNKGNYPLPRVPIKVALVQGKDTIKDLDKTEQKMALIDEAVNLNQNAAQLSTDINQEQIQTKITNKLEEFITDIGQAKLNLDQISNIAGKTNFAQVDPTQNIFFTKNSGKANIITQIIEGTPNKVYHLQFEGQNILSQKTQTFLLKNHILSVNFLSDIENGVKLLSDSQTITNIQFRTPEKSMFDDSKKNIIIKTDSLDKPLYILEVLKMQIQYDDAIYKVNPYQKSLKFKIYKYIDPAAVQKQLDKVKQTSLNLTAKDIADLTNQEDDQAQQQNMASILSKTFTVIISAGNVYRLAKPTEVNAPTIYESYNQDNNGYLSINNLKIKFSNYGRYQLSVIVDGIQSPLSFGLFIEKPDPKNILEYDYVQIIIDFGFIILLYFCATLSSNHETVQEFQSNESNQQNQKQVYQTKDNIKQLIVSQQQNEINNRFIRPKKSRNSILTLIAMIFGMIILIIQSIDIIFFIDSSQNFIGWIFRLINTGIFFITFVIQFIRSLKKNYFFQSRNEIFYEYTFQKLFQRPSRRWINQISQINKKIVSTDNQEYANQLENYKIEKQLFLQKKNSLFQGIVASLTPFRVSQKRLCVDDAYFLPQRIIGSIYISVFSIAFMFYKILLLAFNLKSSIMAVFLQTKQQYISFIAAANRKVQQAIGNIFIDEATFNTTQNMLQEAQKMLESFLDAMSVAIYVSASLSLLLFLFSILKLLYNFKQRVIEMRKGEYRYDMLKSIGNFQSGFQFLPFHVSNSMIAFLIFFLVFAIALTILFWPLFWILIWDNITKILTIIASAILSSISLIVAKKIIFDEQQKCYKNRTFLPIYQIYMIYLSIMAGIFTSVVRFIKTAAIGLFTIYVVDEAAFVGWVMRLTFADAITKTYLVTLQINYIYNNPIKECFDKLIKDASLQHRLQNKENDKSKFEKNDITIYDESALYLNNQNQNDLKKKLKLTNLSILTVRNKMWLLYFMHQNKHIQLYKFRKQYLQQNLDKTKQLIKNSELLEKTINDQENNQLIINKK